MQENEAVSALRKPAHSEYKPNATKLAHDWIKKNGLKPIDFQYSWCAYFESASDKGINLQIFDGAKKFVEGLSQNILVKGFSEFEFAAKTLPRLLSKESKLHQRGSA